MTRTIRAALSTAAEQAAPAGAAVPRDERVMLVADSVGLGTRGVFANAFPPDWEAAVVGEPARFVEQLDSDFVIPNLDRMGDHVVIAGGCNEARVS